MVQRPLGWSQVTTGWQEAHRGAPSSGWLAVSLPRGPALVLGGAQDPPGGILAPNSLTACQCPHLPGDPAALAHRRAPVRRGT